MNVLNIEGRKVGPGHPCLIIAEIGQAHDGSLGTAHAYVDAVARAGADAIKFQTHIASAESTPRETWRIQFSMQDATRHDYWRRMEFTKEQWAGLAEHCREMGLLFLSSAFSSEAVDLLRALGMPAWKIASGEVTTIPLLEEIAETGRPVILSSGMSPWEDLDRAAGLFREAGNELAVMQCTTAYPCPPERVGLNVMAELRERYDCPVGLSDHSGTIWPAVAATVLGADLIEVHAVFSKECFGPDTPASVTTGELAQLVTGVRFVEKMVGNPVDKALAAEEFADLRATFGKSIVAARALEPGRVIEPGDLAFKKPGTGLPASRAAEVIGRRLSSSLAADDLVKLEDLERS